MQKEIINTSAAPKPIGPYSQGVKWGNVVFYSGTIALDPQSGEMKGETAAAQTEQIMENIKALLAAENMDFSHILKSSIFLKNMDDFPSVNETYARYFKDNFPARETVEVSGLPKNALVEISIVCGSR